ncbi:hypothetical protein O7635_12960 [Asanoa sp. WMMD1127]|uniref:sialidase family protein n=1 Tax=Asanoa sp. WMMD1127 TaxID=3016107 RepID=UPI00241631D9|nr:hypothetical protein [Asanoa sp. WMMD1127]MDG4822760.1 hypothetical protein [Asanoa sp. WMMD1127]
MPDLDNRLARSRSALLDEIDQPPLADVRRRAGRIRRRRAAAAGATALALLGVIGIGARPWEQDGPPTVTATEPAPTSPTAPVYGGGGIVITGLSGDPVHDIAGETADVEFVDSTHGIAAPGCDRRCPALAHTTDGGLTWQAVPASPEGDGPTDVLAFPAGHWLARTAGGWWSSQTGSSWQPVTPMKAGPRTVIGPGELPGIDPATGAVVAVSWNHGPLGPLAQQPDLYARWVAPAAAGDGAWWVGGVAGAAPAVAVSRDSGRTWKTTSLPAPGRPTDAVSVSTLGAEVYAVARGNTGEVLGIYHSADGGTSFEATFLAPSGDVDGPPPFAGDAVPLLDGRLLLAQPGGTPSSWWVSTDAGRTFSPIADLPAVGTIRRTHVGYVAYNLFESSWTAYSPNGTNWQKLQVH